MPSILQSLTSFLGIVISSLRTFLRLTTQPFMKKPWTNGRTERIHLPSSMKSKAYKLCGCWGGELLVENSSPDWLSTRLAYFHIQLRLKPELTLSSNRYCPICTSSPRRIRLSFIKWWTLFTLFEPDTPWVFRVWTLHWKFWFNEVCFP
jgi:hypothetical protein